MTLTHDQIKFLEVGAGMLAGFAVMFWCGWVSRDGRVRHAEQAAELAESRISSARSVAAQWEANSDRWAERAARAESKVAEFETARENADANLQSSLTKIADLETKLSSSSKGPSARASKPQRRRGARGRFIKSGK